GQEFALELRAAGTGTEFLILDVIAAQRVTVQQESLRSMKVENERFGNQPRAATRGKLRSQEQIAISMHQVERSPALHQAAQRIRNARVERFCQVVVSDPVIEEVAENIDRIGA